MKKCKQCGVEKALDAFYKHPSGKCGVKSKCKLCYISNQKKYYYDNATERIAYQLEWEKNNRDKKLQNRALYNKRHPEKHLASNAARRARERNDKLTEEQKRVIQGLYRLAKLYRFITGEHWHVDHIIPLRGERVSGLHIPANLQVVPASYNLSKGNRFQVE